MKDDFRARFPELKLLEQAFASPDSGLIPIYGRRRVGKSTLIRHFMVSHPGIYAVGKQGPASLQLQDWMGEAALALGDPLLARIAPTGWRDALHTVVDRFQGKGKLILVLDEFQWMVEASPELPSVIQDLWDRDWSASGRVLLILCGSYLGFMEREVLGAQSPLFGRRTAQIHLQPFTFREARAFHADWSLAEAAKVWFVCGGIPAYLLRFDPTRSFEINLREQLFDDFAPLHREPDFLLREELRDVQSYYAVLMALAAGAASATEIAQKSGIAARSLPYYLQQLVELRYVRRRHPLDGNPPVTRHVRYTLADPLLRFWFRFVYPHLSMLGHLGPALTYARAVAPALPAWFGRGFEGLCREAMPFLYAEEGVEAAFEIGEYWAKDVQIDLVGLRQDGVTDLGECRWGDVGSAAAVGRELHQKAARFPNGRGATIRHRVLSQQRPPGRLPAELPWIDLAGLYGEEATQSRP